MSFLYVLGCGVGYGLFECGHFVVIDCGGN